MPNSLEYRLYGRRWNRRWLTTLHPNGRNDFSRALAACDGRWVILAEVAVATGINRNSLKAYLNAGAKKRLLHRRLVREQRPHARPGFQARYEYRLTGT